MIKKQWILPLFFKTMDWYHSE